MALAGTKILMLILIKFEISHFLASVRISNTNLKRLFRNLLKRRLPHLDRLAQRDAVFGVVDRQPRHGTLRFLNFTIQGVDALWTRYVNLNLLHSTS